MHVDVIEPTLATTETADEINPFLDIALNVSFTSPDGREFVVPGFYAGDGQGNGNGAVWRTRFSPDSTGPWQYRVSFLTGNEIAINPSPLSKSLPGDGEQGSFQVIAQTADAGGFLSRGRLQYVGEHYMQFADGSYWIKSGVDSPENLFGFAGFDGTVDQAGGLDETGLTDGLHHYEAHIGDWREGDPEFNNSDTGVSGRGLIGAINYLASEGINSVYFLPMNLAGDGRDTYPFVGTSGSRFDNTHYDISKLHQWNQVLSHMQEMGVAAHIVLGEQEIGNTNWLDDGELGVERKLFYRELVARFSYLMAIKWNLSEESRFSAEQHLQFAGFLRQQDWAQHPISVHTRRNLPDERYADLLGSPLFEATSIQFSPENAGRFVEDWRTNSHDASRRWIIDMDEVGPAGIGLTASNADELRREVLYPVYFSGGQLEWYFGYHDLPLGGDIRTEDFRTRQDMYRYMKIAREFMEQHLPFSQMEPSDSLFASTSNQPVEVFAKAGELYAVYLPDQAITGEINIPDGAYEMTWFDPTDGSESETVVKTAESGLAVNYSQFNQMLDTVSSNNDDASAGQDRIILLRKVETAAAETNANSELGTVDEAGQENNSNNESDSSDQGDVDTASQNEADSEPDVAAALEALPANSESDTQDSPDSSGEDDEIDQTAANPVPTDTAAQSGNENQQEIAEALPRPRSGAGNLSPLVLLVLIVCGLSRNTLNTFASFSPLFRAD